MRIVTGIGGFTGAWFVAMFENLTVGYIQSTTAELPGSVKHSTAKQKVVGLTARPILNLLILRV